MKKWSPLSIVLALSGVFFFVFMLISGLLFVYNSPSGGGSARSGGALFGAGGGYVGVLELKGVIFDSKKVIKKLEDFDDDPRVKAVVLRLNSPGGSVAPSQEIYEAVRAMKKPVVASMASVAASGGYYIACAAKKIFANPGTITGSIGVIMEFVNLGRLYEWAKIERYALKTGKFKGAGAEYKAMSPEERELFQGMLDDVLKQFKNAVATGRKMKMSEVDKIADGRVFSGNQAKAAKLVDELGTLKEAIAEAGKMAGIKGEPKVIYPGKHRKRFVEMLFDEATDDEDAEESRSFVSGILDSFLKTETNQTKFTPGLYWLWSAQN
jgi:protease IV